MTVDAYSARDIDRCQYLVHVDAGIFTRDTRGVWAYYSLVPDALDALSAVLRPAR